MARNGMSNLITRVRGLIADDWELHQDTAVTDGVGSIFWLNHKPNSNPEI